METVTNEKKEILLSSKPKLFSIGMITLHDQEVVEPHN
jgi:hypothetical protein